MNFIDEETEKIMSMSPSDSIDILTKTQTCNFPYKRKQHIKNITRSPEASYRVFANYNKYLNFTPEERKLLFESVLKDSSLFFCINWFTSCSPTKQEQLILANIISGDHNNACDLLSQYPNIEGDVRDVLINSVLYAPIYAGRALINTKNLTDNHREKLFNKMIEDIGTLSSIFSMIYYHINSDIFTSKEWKVIIDTVIKEKNSEIAFLINETFPKLPDEFLSKIEHLVLLQQILYSN